MEPMPTPGHWLLFVRGGFAEIFRPAVSSGARGARGRLRRRPVPGTGCSRRVCPRDVSRPRQTKQRPVLSSNRRAGTGRCTFVRPHASTRAAGRRPQHPSRKDPLRRCPPAGAAPSALPRAAASPPPGRSRTRARRAPPCPRSRRRKNKTAHAPCAPARAGS